MTTPSRANAGGPATADRIVRHALPDRLFHWLGAACVLVLLGTAFLPIVGVEFGWVTVHWMTGLVLVAAVLFHIVRVLVRGTWGSMWLGRADVADALDVAARHAASASCRAAGPGKYSVAQKLIHHAFAVVVLTTSVTGSLMLARIDTPWWQRNPYLLADATWGIVYVLHGLAALLLITMVMMHVYFALRPEKLKFTRAMIRGWITRREFDEHHDPTTLAGRPMTTSDDLEATHRGDRNRLRVHAGVRGAGPRDATKARPPAATFASTSTRWSLALDGLAAVIDACASGLDSELPKTGAAFFAAVDADARIALAAIRLVLSRADISSQLIDNLNASIHLRALLTDLFIVDEALKPPKARA